MSDQKQLDEATADLRRIITGLDRLSKLAHRRADQECGKGNLRVSANLRAIEANLRDAAACATRAYGEGRGLELPSDGGTITPFFGGNK
jgi:GH24 family phage-related lysozyme (muramidase)